MMTWLVAMVSWLARLTATQDLPGSNRRCRQFLCFFLLKSLRYTAFGMGSSAHLLQLLGRLSLIPFVGRYIEWRGLLRLIHRILFFLLGHMFVFLENGHKVSVCSYRYFRTELLRICFRTFARWRFRNTRTLLTLPTQSGFTYWLTASQTPACPWWRVKWLRWIAAKTSASTRSRSTAPTGKLVAQVDVWLPGTFSRTSSWNLRTSVKFKDGQEKSEQKSGKSREICPVRENISIFPAIVNVIFLPCVRQLQWQVQLVWRSFVDFMYFNAENLPRQFLKICLGNVNTIQCTRLSFR